VFPVHIPFIQPSIHPSILDVTLVGVVGLGEGGHEGKKEGRPLKLIV
jgi:hypothetical protein